MFRFLAPDHRRRMLLSNCLARIADRLEESLHQVRRKQYLYLFLFCFLFVCWSLFAFAWQGLQPFRKGIPKVWALHAWGLASCNLQPATCNLSVCLFFLLNNCNLKVWALLEAEEDAAGLKMKETLEQLHQSRQFVKN